MGYLQNAKKVVTNKGIEAVFAEGVNVGNEVGADGEVAGAAEEGLGGGAEGVVAAEDFVDGIVGEGIEDP